METTRNLVNSIIMGNAIDVEDTLNIALTDKIIDKFDEMKTSIANSIFQVDEKLSIDDPIDKWINDFQISTAPQFNGMSKIERRNAAIAAFNQSRSKR